MAHAEKLLALIEEERLRQMRVKTAVAKPIHRAIRDELERAEDNIERSAELLAKAKRLVGA